MCDKWFPTKKEIDKWIDQNVHAFTTQENRSPKLSKEQWLQRFLYIDETDVFFYFFPKELYEWLSKLAYNQGTWRLNGPIVWNSELVQCLEALESNITRVVDHWIDRTLGSVVIDFAINRNFSYSEA